MVASNVELTNPDQGGCQNAGFFSRQYLRPFLLGQGLTAVEVEAQHTFCFGQGRLGGVALHQAAQQAVGHPIGQRLKEGMKYHPLAYRFGLNAHAELKFIDAGGSIQRVQAKEDALNVLSRQKVCTG